MTGKNLHYMPSGTTPLSYLLPGWVTHYHVLLLLCLFGSHDTLLKDEVENLESAKQGGGRSNHKLGKCLYASTTLHIHQNPLCEYRSGTVENAGYGHYYQFKIYSRAEAIIGQTAYGCSWDFATSPSNSIFPILLPIELDSRKYRRWTQETCV